MSASREKRKRRQEGAAEQKKLTGKQQQQRQDAFRRTIAIVVASVVLLGLAVLAITATGVLQANLTALTVGGVKISGAEFDYHYFLSYYQNASYFSEIDTTKPFGNQKLSDGSTVGELIESVALSSLQQIVLQSEQAKKDGISLADADKLQIDKIIADVEESAASQGKKPDALLREYYGRGITLASYRTFLERYYLSMRFQTEKYKSYTRTDEELEAYYSENRTDYDTIDYHTFTISMTPPAREEGEDAYTEEEIEAYKAAQRSKADEMLVKVTTSEAFKALSLEYTPVTEDEEETSGEDEDASGEGEDAGDEEDSSGDDEDAGDEGSPDDGEDASEEEETDNTFIQVAASSVSSVLSEYLLDESRKTGDKTVIEDGDNLIVLLFVDRTRSSDKVIDVRHILISTDDYDTEEEASARAEELYQQWKNGAANEDSFAALASEYTADTSSATNGGLYTNVTRGYMVEEFDAWCFDPERSPGDSGIVETEHGYHIMYFVGENIEWKAAVKSDMDYDDYEEMFTALTDANPVKTNWFGMLFTKIEK